MRDTIEMAREAGYGDHMAVLHGPALKRFEALVRADEREACARVCDGIDVSFWGCEVKASWCSEAIRARGQA
jgi:hypothetical protein